MTMVIVPAARAAAVTCTTPAASVAGLEWLHETAKDTVLTPIEREEWLTLSGSRALKVINDRSENIYAVRGPLTIAIRYDRSPQAVTRQIISTFRFTARQ
jgi:hypothetical protein